MKLGPVSLSAPSLPRLSSRPARVGACLLAATVFSSLAGCVSNDEYKRLNTSFEQARSQLAEAENDLAASRAKIAELEARIAQLDKLNGNEGLDAIRKERDLLAQQLADLQKKYNDLLAMADNGPALPEPVNAALRDLAAKYPNLLEFDERLGMLRLKSDLTFDVGSTEVRPQAKEALAKLAQIFDMPEIAKNEIQVVGHTDDIPIRQTNTMRMNPTNDILSTNRAWAVADVLRTDGVNHDRLMASGWGEERPIVPNAPGHRGNEKNRRVDIYVRPTTVPDNLVISSPGAAPAPRSTPARSRSTTPRSTPARSGATGRPAATMPAVPMPGE
ncbi:MAG TPA: OmpA family protein [Phycisphaerae bacterium]|nr:OmpA family protein [Phycisphaerae bacterium]